jgi:hypothetical protein
LGEEEEDGKEEGEEEEEEALASFVKVMDEEDGHPIFDEADEYKGLQGLFWRYTVEGDEEEGLPERENCKLEGIGDVYVADTSGEDEEEEEEEDEEDEDEEEGEEEDEDEEEE